MKINKNIVMFFLVMLPPRFLQGFFFSSTPSEQTKVEQSPAKKAAALKYDAQMKKLERKRKHEEDKRRLELYRLQKRMQRKEEDRLLLQSRKEEHHAAKKQKQDLIKRWQEKKRETEKEEEYEGKYADLYMVPTWPIHAWRFKHEAMVNILMQNQTSNRAFGPSGSSHNLAKLAFGKTNFQLQDILVTSKLLAEGLVAFPTLSPSLDDFLSILGPTDLAFKASQEEWRIALDFARHVVSNDITVGIQLPFVWAHHTVNMDVTLPTGALDAMTKTTATGTPFRQQFGGSFDRFFNTLFTQYKGMKFQKHTHLSGLGDIKLYANLELHSGRWDQAVVGLSVSIPTGNKQSMKKFWAPQLGNGGFPAVSLFGGLLISKDYNINPHLFFQLTFSAPKSVNRRVPQFKNFNGQTFDNMSLVGIAADGTMIGQLLPFGNLVFFQEGVPFSQPDTTLKEFADQSARVRISPGFQTQFRIGNIFEKFIFRRGFLDVYYELGLKAKDDARIDQASDDFVTSILEIDSGFTSHKLGFDYNYQIDGSTRVRFGTNYIVNGRNAIQILELYGSFNVDF